MLECLVGDVGCPMSVDRCLDVRCGAVRCQMHCLNSTTDFMDTIRENSCWEWVSIAQTIELDLIKDALFI